MEIKKNMGNADRIVRSSIAVLIVGLSFSGIIHGPLGIALLTISAVFVITSIYAFCPLYALLHISSCSRSRKPS